MTTHHAIVLGGSMAGMMAAQQLSQIFDHVTILERDVLPTTPDYRKGVPQARHAHAFLYRGLLILEAMYPGFRQDLLNNGGVSLNVGRDLAWTSGGVTRPRYDSAIESISAGRIIIEHTVRARLLQNPKIRVLNGADVIGLVTDDTNTRATGVNVRFTSGSTIIDADLVVDCTGRNTRAPEWLEQLGYERPATTIIDPHGGYTSFIVEYDADAQPWKGFYIQPTAPHITRGAIMLPFDATHGHVTLVGMGNDLPPTNDEEMEAFIDSVPNLRGYLSQTRRVSENNYGYRQIYNRVYHYERMERQLENFIAMGDSAVALDPVYGQGMTIAAISSEVLLNALKEHLERFGSMDSFSTSFQKQLFSAVFPALALSSGEDLRWPGAEGQVLVNDPGMALMDTYVQKLLMVANYNPAVLEAFYHLAQMVAGPDILFRPDIVLQVINEVGVPKPELVS